MESNMWNKIFSLNTEIAYSKAQLWQINMTKFVIPIISLFSTANALNVAVYAYFRHLNILGPHFTRTGNKPQDIGETQTS